jgi:hypothetical protein
MKKSHEVLFEQLKSYRSYTLSCLEGLTEEQADFVPKGFRNNIRWNLGHLYLDQYLWIQAITKEPILLPEKFQDWFGFGTSPSDWQDTPPDLDRLRKLLASQPNDIHNVYGERLEEEFPPSEEDGIFTIAQVLVRTIFHEGMHLETIKTIRRLV